VERPILFSSDMVRAILDGRKTQTRRVIKPQPTLGHTWRDWIVDPETMDLPTAYCPYGQSGDRLWVRETFTYITKSQNEYSNATRPDGVPVEVIYRADGEADCTWTPSIFMPRWACRITLEIVNVRIEQVQSISPADAIAEGWPKHLELFPLVNQESKALRWFQYLWDSINAKRGFDWGSNPWVWVIEFMRSGKNDT